MYRCEVCPAGAEPFVTKGGLISHLKAHQRRGHIHGGFINQIIDPIRSEVFDPIKRPFERAYKKGKAAYDLGTRGVRTAKAITRQVKKTRSDIQRNINAYKKFIPEIRALAKDIQNLKGSGISTAQYTLKGKPTEGDCAHALLLAADSSGNRFPNEVETDLLKLANGKKGGIIPAALFPIAASLLGSVVPPLASKVIDKIF